MPAGVISLYIDLRRPIFLTEDQQDYSCVNSLDPETLSSPYRFEHNASQPFALSEEIYMRDVHDLPATCKARLDFLFFYTSLIPWRKLRTSYLSKATMATRAALPSPLQCAVCLCVRTMIQLPVFRICNMGTQMLMHTLVPEGLYIHCRRVYTENTSCCKREKKWNLYQYCIQLWL